MRILLIEDNHDDVRALKEYLAEVRTCRFEVTQETRLSAGVNRLAEQNFDAVLLDLALSGSQGLDTVIQVRAAAKKMPLVVLTEVEDEALAVRLTQAGVQDYLVKGQVSGPLLTKSLRYAAELARMEKTVSEVEHRFQQLADNAPVMAWMTEPDATCSFLSKSWYEFTGQTPETSFGFGWLDAVHPDDRAAARDIFVAANAERKPFRLDYRLRRKDGEYRWAVDAAAPRVDGEGRFLGYIGSVMDITDRKKSDQLEADQKRVLELIAKDAPLSTVFETLIRMIEKQSAAHMVASILLMDADGIHLRSCAAPSLPETYNSSIDGMAIGPHAGSCGTAAYRRRPVYVSDIANDPLWAKFAPLALPHNLRACWSTPILSSTGQLFGTLAMYYPDVREPNKEDLRLVDVATRLAAIAIERKRAEEALRLAKFSVERAADAVYWIDSQAKILDVNEAASRMLSYSKDELCAMTIHDLNPDFQADMWPGFWAETQRRGTMMVETVHRAKNGRLIPIEVSVNFLVHEGKEYHCAFVRDITERKRAEEERNKQESLISLMLNTGPGCIKRVAADGTLLQMNPAGLRLIEAASEDEVVGRCVFDLVVAEHRAAFIDMHRDVLAGRSHTIQYEIQGLKGTRRWMETHAAPFRNPVSGETEHLAVTHDITERKQAERQLRDTLDRVRKLSQRLESVREEERTRIARELHDELGVRLTCFRLDLARLRSFMSWSPVPREEIENKIHSMTAEVDATIASVQRLVTELRPGILDDLGLAAAVEWQCQDLERRSGIRCSCEGTEEHIPLAKPLATAAFRICQEALTNVVRHAEATAVRVRIEQVDGYLQLEVNDDGIGISPDKLSDSRSFGLLGMRERAASLGGQIEIAGRPEKGTTVTLQLPLNMEDKR
ncbi:MAG: Two-component system sensor histidine kinase [Nitrospira sp.]|nr:MAG: Two-component system sensor histidine kinase [Nitrospira sp.]